MSLMIELAQLANVCTSYLHTICVACRLRALSTQRDASCVPLNEIKDVSTETKCSFICAFSLFHDMFEPTLYLVSFIAMD